MKDEVLEVAAFVNQLRAEDTDLRVFGADCHEYRIGPTLSEAEILRFEREHQITLPQDYRLWLQLVGDGSGLEGRWPIAGVGPNYGIYHLKDSVLDSRPDVAFRPTRLPKEKLQGTGDYEAWAVDFVRQEGEDESVEPESRPGLLDMGTRGCAYETYLVVNGEGYGTIWESWEGREFQPSGFTFLQWVRNWAERALPRVIREHASDPIGVGMTKAQAIAICSEDWEEKPWTTSTRFLRFQNMVTQFELDRNDKIIRVIKHSI